ncbi:MAG: fused MFS/spermidine synthase, partial [Kovacikia sp.]
GRLSGLRLTLPLSAGILFGILLIGFTPQFLNYHLIGALVALGLTGAIAVVFALHPARLTIGLIFVLLLGQFSLSTLGGVLATDRSFFGVYRVLRDRTHYLSLLHGTTLHGKQSLDPNRQHEPLTYFYPTGPVGQVFQTFGPQRFSQVAVLGLGIGTLAAYAQPGQHWTFYEIDPTDETLAHRYFTFLQQAPADIDIITGDGRLAVKSAAAKSYDLLVMDAFSSDSIPIHLVTREAIQLYLDKLTDQGLLVINISNRYLNLEPILGALAQDLGLVTLRQLELTVTEAERKLGKTPSHWVLLAKHQQNFGGLLNDSRWQPIPITANAPLWTDDFSDIFRVIRAFRRSSLNQS